MTFKGRVDINFDSDGDPYEPYNTILYLDPTDSGSLSDGYTGQGLYNEVRYNPWISTRVAGARMAEDFVSSVTVTNAGLRVKAEGTGTLNDIASPEVWFKRSDGDMDIAFKRILDYAHDYTNGTWVFFSQKPPYSTYNAGVRNVLFQIVTTGLYNKVWLDDAFFEYEGFGIPCDHESGDCNAGIQAALDEIEFGSPISYQYGEKREHVTDLSLNTPAGELSFTRHYRQKKNIDRSLTQPLGLGWTHNHNQYLDLSDKSNGNIKLHMSKGGFALFEEDPNDSTHFNAKAGGTSTIIEANTGDPGYDASRHYELDADSQSYFFDTAGKLRYRQWLSGEEWSFHYNGSDQLLYIDDGYGRRLVLRYYTSGDHIGQLYRVGDQTFAPDPNNPGLDDTSKPYVEYSYSQEKLDGVVQPSPASLLTGVQDVRGHSWLYDYYGQDSGEDTQGFANWLLSYTSPIADLDGDGSVDERIILKDLIYGDNNGNLTIQERLGKPVSGANYLLDTSFEFNTTANQTTETTSDSRTITHYFNAAGYQGKAYPGQNANERYMDFNYRPSQQIDENGNVTWLGWSNDGKNLMRVLDADGNRTGFGYDAQGRLIRSRDAEGRVTIYTYDDVTYPNLRQPQAIISSKDGVNERYQYFAYDSLGRVTSEKLLDHTVATPDPNTDVLQEVQRSYYSSGVGAGLLKDVTQVGGDNPKTTYTYDEQGRVIKVKRESLFGTCEYTFTVYDEAGNTVATVCTSDQNVTQPTTLNEALLLFDETEPELVNITTYTYDELGRQVAVTVRDGLYGQSDDTPAPYRQTQRTVYDALGRVVRTIDNYVEQSTAPAFWEWANGRWEDGSGTPIAHGTCSDQNLIQDTAYNARGLVKMRRNTVGMVSVFGYDTADRLVKVIQNAVQTSTGLDFYDVDVEADIALSSYPTSSTAADEDIITSNVYDAAGNLIKSTDARGATTLMGYNKRNQAVKVITNASAPSHDMAADPELAGYPLSTDPDVDQVQETTYNPLGQAISSRTLLEGRGTTPVWVESRTVYDALGRQEKTIQNYVPQATDPSLWEWVTDHWEDGAGTPADIDHGTNNDENLISQTVYDVEGRVLYTLDIDGNKTWQTYDGLNRPKKTIQNASYISGTPPEDSGYEGDKASPDLDLIAETHYDNEGRVQKVQRILRTDISNNLEWLYTLYGYDAKNRQVKVVQNASAPSGSFDADLSNYAPDPLVDDTDADIISKTDFDDQGRVWRTIDTRDNVTLYGYDQMGRQVKVVRNASDATYNQDGSDPTLANYEPAIGAQVDQDRVSETIYDLAGRVIESISTGFEDVNNVFVPVSRVSHNVYDQLGRRIRTIANYIEQTDSQSQVVDPADWVWEGGVWKQGAGGTVIDHGDDDANIISVTTYNKAGQVTQTQDARGTLTGFEYDNAGRRLTVTRAKNDPNNLETTDYTCYDKVGRVLRTIRNLTGTPAPDAWTGDAWTFAPSSHGANNDENLISEFVYDKANRRIQTTNPAGDTSLTRYFTNGRIDTMTDPEETVTAYRYDRLGRRTIVVQGYVPQATDPSLWEWANNQWEDGNSTAIVHGTDTDENIIVKVTYDKSGRMVSMRDPEGHETIYEYDKLNRRTLLQTSLDISESGQPAKFQKWETAYDDVGQATQVTMKYPGLSATNEYDVVRTFDRLGRPVQIDYNDPSTTPKVAFAYDALGNQVALSEYNNSQTLIRQTQYSYDDRNRLIAVGFDADGDETPEQTVNYAYDLSGQRTQLTMPDGAGGTFSVTYEYDAKGRLIGLTDWDSENSSFAYDGVDRHIHTSRPNQITSDYSYDPAGRLVDLLHQEGTTTKAQFSYVVDGRGNRVQAMETLRQPNDTLTQQTISYGYDKLQRLTSAVYDTDRSYAYQYDRAGNRLQEQVTIDITTTTTNWTYNQANQIATMQIGANPAVNFTYDANGNLVSDGQLTYTWDRANRQTKINNGSFNTHFAYDGAGNRYRQTVGGDVTDYLNDLQPGLTQMIASTNDGVMEHFVHGPNGIHAHYVAGSASNGAIWGQSVWGQAVWGDTATPGSPEWHYMLQDGLGSVRLETDANADVLANQSYAPYGLPFDVLGTFESPFGFTGEQTDDSDQVYLRARYYAPSLGVFTTLDPWEGIQDRPMSLNGYSWVEGNVINAGDPSGRIIDWIEDRIYEFGDTASSAIGWARDNVDWEAAAYASAFYDSFVCSGPLAPMGSLTGACGDPIEQAMRRFDPLGTLQRELQGINCLPPELRREYGYRKTFAVPLSNTISNFAAPINRTTASIQQGHWADAFLGAFDIMSGGSVFEMREGFDTLINGSTFAGRLAGGGRLLMGAASFGMFLYGGYTMYSRLRTQLLGNRVNLVFSSDDLSSITNEAGGVRTVRRIDAEENINLRTRRTWFSGSISRRQAIRSAQLPTEGRIRYIPPDTWHPSEPLPRGINYGYIDRFGNEWVRGPSRTVGELFEWDVQLSLQGKSMLGWLTNDNHINVSLKGRVTH